MRCSHCYFAAASSVVASLVVAVPRLARDGAWGGEEVGVGIARRRNNARCPHSFPIEAGRPLQKTDATTLKVHFDVKFYKIYILSSEPCLLAIFLSSVE